MSDKYAALRAAAKNATPGEWRSDDHHGVIADAGLNGNYYIASCSGPEHRDNKRFIAAANPATILELLAERDADRARIAEQCGIILSARKFIGEYAGLGDVGATEFLRIIDRAAGISLKIEGE